MRKQSGFAHVGLFIFIIIIILAIVGVGLKVKSRSSSKQSGSNAGYFDKLLNKKDNKNQQENYWTQGCTNKNRAQMTHLPMNINDVASFTPYGITAGAHVTPIDHLYFYPKAGPRDKYPVYAMADGFITEITVRGVNVDSGEKRPPEYRYMIQHSCQTISYFDLVTKLDQSILNEYPDAATKGMTGRFPVKAGQEVGRIGAQSLDTAVYNMELTLPGFIHPEMYKAEPWKIHTDDFFSYFSEEHQAQMLALSQRKVKPYSGKIDYDQPGKLIGNWFIEGTNGYEGANKYGMGDGTGRGYWSGHLSIHYHYINSTDIVISLGEFKDGDPQAFAVKGNAPDPASVSKDSGIVKYELTQLSLSHESKVSDRVLGVVLFQVLDGEKLKVEISPDKTAAQVSGFVSPTVYER